jgi:hypothetical protein
MIATPMVPHPSTQIVGLLRGIACFPVVVVVEGCGLEGVSWKKGGRRGRSGRGGRGSYARAVVTSPCYSRCSHVINRANALLDTGGAKQHERASGLC